MTSPSTIQALASDNALARAAGIAALQSELALTPDDATFEAATIQAEQQQGEYTAERYMRQYPDRVTRVIALLRQGTAVRQIKAIFTAMGWGIHHNTIKAIREAHFTDKELNDILLTKQRRIADSTADEIADTLDEIRNLPIEQRVKILDKLAIVHGITSDKVQGSAHIILEIQSTAPASLGQELLAGLKASSLEDKVRQAIDVTPQP